METIKELLKNDAQILTLNQIEEQISQHDVSI